MAVAVVFYKLIQYRALQLDVREFFGQIRQELLNGRVKEAGELCERRRGPVSSVLHAGILKIGAPRNEVESAMEATALYELARLEGSSASWRRLPTSRRSWASSARCGG